MKTYRKKAAVLAMAGILAAGSMAGCSKDVDGTKTVTTVNDEAIKLGTVNFLLRYQQAQTAQMYAMYFGGSTDGIWSSVADEETGETYGEQTVKEVVEQLEDMTILRQHAKDYDVKISKKEQKKITKAAKEFLEANDEETIAKLGVDQETIEEALSLSYYNTMMFAPMTADVDTEVSDEEAAQTGVTFVRVEESTAEEEGDAVDAKTKAQQILDEVLATADADMDAIAKGVDEGLSATTTHFDTNAEEEEETETVPQEIQDAVKNLTDGEVAGELIEADSTYYVVRLDAAFDAQATEDQKGVIISERKQEAYNDTTEQWREDAEITQDEKVIESLSVTDNDKYSFKAEEAAEEEGEVEEADTTETAEENVGE